MAKGKDAPVFEKRDLIKGAAHFNTTPEVMAGALYEVSEALTAEQAQAKLQEFIDKPIEGGK